jgi:hypothetical protein
MMRRFLMSRRSLLARTAAGLGGLVAGWMATVAAGDGTARASSLEDALSRLCAQMRCPKTVGNACRAALPATETRRSLMASLFRDAGLSASEPLSPNGLARRLREQSRDDFRAGRTVTVDGWILSLTETRLYALASLLRAPGAVSRRLAG